MFIHSQKRNPQTHLKDPNMVWDFFATNPQATHQVRADDSPSLCRSPSSVFLVSDSLFGSWCSRWISIHAWLRFSYLQNGQREERIRLGEIPLQSTSVLRLTSIGRFHLCSSLEWSRHQEYRANQGEDPSWWTARLRSGWSLQCHRKERLSQLDTLRSSCDTRTSAKAAVQSVRSDESAFSQRLSSPSCR